MELLILLGLLAWAFPLLSKRVAESASRTTDGAARPARPAQPRAVPQPVSPRRPQEPEKELCPIEKELRGRQASLPAWGGTALDGAQEHEIIMEGFGDHRKRPSQQATEREHEREAQPVEIPGLDLKFNQDALVAGVVFAEILARRSARRRR